MEKSPHPDTYQIQVEGHLSDQWIEWFGGMAISREENGTTLIAGVVADQAELHGLLKKVRDLGMPLLSVRQAACIRRESA